MGRKSCKDEHSYIGKCQVVSTGKLVMTMIINQPQFNMLFATPLSQMTRAQSLRPQLLKSQKLINIPIDKLAHLLPWWNKIDPR